MVAIGDWCGAKLAQLCRKAAMLALREAVMVVGAGTARRTLQVQNSHFVTAHKTM